MGQGLASASSSQRKKPNSHCLSCAHASKSKKKYTETGGLAQHCRMLTLPTPPRKAIHGHLVSESRMAPQFLYKVYTTEEACFGPLYKKKQVQQSGILEAIKVVLGSLSLGAQNLKEWPC